MRNALAQQTLQTVDAALKSGQVASLPELVQIIRALSQDAGKVSVSELADMINQDSTVLMRVIAAANTFGYNPTNVEISNVADAIHTIGFNRVRVLAMSLMLLDHAGRSSTSTEQRRMSAVSLCSGFLAQVAAEHAGVLDPETAFVCASLRNFGRLLLGTFMLDEFRDATTASESGEGDAAYQRIFGLTPFALGYELLKSAQLPETILHAVRHYAPPDLNALTWSDRAMYRLANFSLELSELALDDQVDDHAFAAKQLELVTAAAKDFPFLSERAPNLLGEAEHRLTVLASAAGKIATTRQSGQRLRQRSRRTPLQGPVDAALAASRSVTAALPHHDPLVSPDAAETEEESPTDESAKVAAAPDLATSLPPEPVATPTPAPRTEAGSPIDLAVQSLRQGRIPIGNLLPLALNAIWRTLNPQDIFFCALDSAGHAFRIVLGRGPISERLGENALFNRRSRNAFLLVHERLNNLSIHNTEDPAVWRHLPDWLQTPAAPRSFLALPVHHQRVLHGVLFLGWPTARDHPFSGPDLSSIQTLLDLVACGSSTTATDQNDAVA